MPAHLSGRILARAASGLRQSAVPDLFDSIPARRHSPASAVRNAGRMQGSNVSQMNLIMIDSGHQLLVKLLNEGAQLSSCCFVSCPCEVVCGCETLRQII